MAPGRWEYCDGSISQAAVLSLPKDLGIGCCCLLGLLHRAEVGHRSALDSARKPEMGPVFC